MRELVKALSVLKSSSGVVNGAWTDHYQQSVILLRYDANSFLSTPSNCFECLRRGWYFGLKELWGYERILTKHYGMFSMTPGNGFDNMFPAPLVFSLSDRSIWLSAIGMLRTAVVGRQRTPSAMYRLQVLAKAHSKVPVCNGQLRWSCIKAQGHEIVTCQTHAVEVSRLLKLTSIKHRKKHKIRLNYAFPDIY